MLKTFLPALFSFIIFGTAAAQSGAANNKFVKQLPKDQKAAFIKSIDGTCDCMNKVNTDMSSITKATEAFSEAVDNFAAAVDAKNLAKADKAMKVLDEKKSAMRTAQKEFQESNKESNECMAAFDQEMSEEEQRLLKAANEKLSELVEAEYSNKKEANKKQQEMAVEMCPALGKIMKPMTMGFEASKKMGEAQAAYYQLQEDAAPAQDEELLNKLNKESKAELDKAAQSICPCLDEYGKDFTAFVDAVESKMDEIKEDPNVMADIMTNLGDKAAAMESFAQCMQKAGEGTDNDVLEKGFEEAFPDLTGNEKQWMQMDLVAAFVKKNCKNSKAFDKFVAFGKKMADLR